jgi:hypothetical protein
MPKITLPVVSSGSFTEIFNQNTGVSSGSTFSWTVPDGVNSLTLTLIGAGGGSEGSYDLTYGLRKVNTGVVTDVSSSSSSSGAANGETTTFIYNGVTYTGPGGKKGTALYKKVYDVRNVNDSTLAATTSSGSGLDFGTNGCCDGVAAQPGKGRSGFRWLNTATITYTATTFGNGSLIFEENLPLPDGKDAIPVVHVISVTPGTAASLYIGGNGSNNNGAAGGIMIQYSK